MEVPKRVYYALTGILSFLCAQFLHDIQYEYAAMVEYQQMLQDLKFVASNIQTTQRNVKLQDETRLRKQRLRQLEKEKRAASSIGGGKRHGADWTSSPVYGDDDDRDEPTQRVSGGSIVLCPFLPLCCDCKKTCV